MDVLALISGEYAGLGSLVVMYKTNPGITSVSLSPTTTYENTISSWKPARDNTQIPVVVTFSIEPDLMKFFSNTLSITGSSSSPTSSISNGLPSDKQSSKCVLKYLWFSDVIWSSLVDSLFLIHIFPWFWGSMSSGYELDFVTISAFCTDSSSLGRPCNVHSDTLNKHKRVSIMVVQCQITFVNRTIEFSTSMFIILSLAVNGTFCVVKMFIQLWTKFDLNSWL